nr:hypothetical protein [Tanacetum cinerariifolium]
FKPEANLDKEMGYLLGGSYHGHDSIVLLNCYGVRRQVEVKQTYANAMFVVRPVWSDFVSKNITQDVECLHFIEEGEDMFYVATYNKYRFEMHGYRQKILCFGGAYSMLQTDPVEPRGKFSLTVFNNAGEALTACKNYTSYVLRNSNCHIRQEPDYNLERMGWYCNWRWHTNHGDERKAFYIKLTSDVLILSRIALSTGMNYADMLQRFGFGFILARIQVWRLESYALKFADDVLRGIFMNVHTVILVFRVIGLACSLIHATARIQAWGKPVWTGIDDVLLLAPVLKHVMPSLVS